MEYGDGNSCASGSRIVSIRRPLVGIAVPVRNAEAWMDEMLVSVREQTYRYWRMIVVDDGSEDASFEIACRHQQADSRIEVNLSPTPASGPSLTRAHGRALLGHDADYLYFPDADDVLEPRLLARLVERLEAEPGAGAVFCRYTRIDEAGQQLDEPPPPRIAMSTHWARRLPDREPCTPFESLYGWAAPAMEPVTMFRAADYDAAGGWEGWPEQGGESIDLLCRMALSGRSVLFEPLPLYRYRRREGQYSADLESLSAAARAIREEWRRRAAFDPSLLPVVERAEFFVEHRLTPRLGVDAAWRLIRSGRPFSAARFVGGAARRYRWRAFPGSPS